MGFLRGLGTVICSIILFLALAVFSIAFLLNSTVLNADFMNSQIDKLDAVSIARDTIEEQITEEIPQDAALLTDVVSDIITAQEPLIKEQIHAGIDAAYAYFLDERSALIITFSLVEIKQSLKDSLWQTAVDYLNEQLALLSDEEVDNYVEDIMAQIPEESLPPELAVLPEDLRNEVIKQYLKELGGRGIFDSLSFNLDFTVEDQVRSYFEQYFDDFVQDIPDTYTIDENSIDPDVMATLREVKRYIGYFQAAYIWLIVFIIVLAGLIFLINWSNVRASLRALGIDLLIFGILDLAGVLLVRNLRLDSYISDYSQLPVSLRSWVDGLFNDVTGTMLWFGIGVLVSGVILFTVSFFVKPREAMD